jgi:uncharacterized protein (TIGR02145 family)
MKNCIRNILLICFIAFTFSQCYRNDNSTLKDIDGNLYKTTLIGKYWWTAENLKTTRYNDGVQIPLVKDQSSWFRLNHDAFCFYQNNENYADTFGFLYNWYTVSSGKICPDGWRVPTDQEWKYLEGFTDSKHGFGDSVWGKMGLRGYDVGLKLKSANGWRPGAKGTDDFGFKGLPGGERLSRFYAGGSSGFWWSSSEASSSSAYYRNLIYSFEQVARDTHPKRMGFSVRCIKDKK